MPTAFRLETRNARSKLGEREEPYYRELRRGLHIGYRRGRTGGSWLLREHRGDRFVKRRLGAADDTVPSDGVSVLSWEEACAAALGADRPTITKPGKYTVAEAAQEYFETRRAVTQHDRFTWAKFIEPKLGARPINDLTTRDLERWLAEQVPATDNREELRARRATANRRWSVLRAILNSAHRKDKVRVPRADAWRDVQAFAKVDAPRKVVLASGKEALRLLDALEPDVRALATGALYTGCRLGELLALRAADVVEGRVHVRHSKSGKDRHVPLSKPGAEFFAQRTAGRAADALVFGIVDTPSKRVALSRRMHAANEVAKITPRVTFHDLRRSYGSLMLNSGAPMEALKDLLGHADMRMTSRVYAHMVDDTLQRTVEEHLPRFSPKPTRVKRRG
jgi:integrase